MHICDQCEKGLSTAYNLRRHLELCHNIKRRPRMCRANSHESDVESDNDASESNNSDRLDNDNDDTVMSEVSDTNDDDATDDQSENWVFDRILNNVDSRLTLGKRQKKFRQILGDFIIWYQHLRKNQIYKKVLETIQNLKDDNDYDNDEAIRAGIERRRFLLDRLISEGDEMSDGENIDDNDSHDEDAEM